MRKLHRRTRSLLIREIFMWIFLCVPQAPLERAKLEEDRKSAAAAVGLSLGGLGGGGLGGPSSGSTKA